MPLPSSMFAQRFEDLEAWQLAMEVNRQVFALTARGRVATDRDLRDQIRSSAASAPRNLAEGFGRGRPAEFANKCRIALGELSETRSSLIDGESRGYFRAADVARISNWIARATMVTRRLVAYLDSCVQQHLYERPRTQGRKAKSAKTDNEKTNNEKTNNEER